MRLQTLLDLEKAQRDLALSTTHIKRLERELARVKSNEKNLEEKLQKAEQMGGGM
jgi:hypothetical protein